MQKKDLLIPEEVIKSAGFESNNLVAIIEDGVIRIVEEDEEYCCGFFVIEVEETENPISKKPKPQPPKEVQILSRKGTVYLPVDIREFADFDIGSILELSIVPEGMLLKRVKM